jgi:GxxExxY protein
MLADPSATNKLTRTIIGCGIRVHTVVGPGLLESTYEACMAFELKESGLDVERRKHVPLIYRGLQLPIAYQLDMLVNGTVIVELKSVDAIAPIHVAQMLTYLRLTGCPVGLLLNFNVPTLKEGIRRIVNPRPPAAAQAK